MFIFISYRKTDRFRVEQLGADLSEMGHEVWFDKELTGGHEWWASILDNIRRCDLFVFALTQDALDSEACQQEYRYAASLHKRILPVKLAEVNTNLLPPELAKIQWVDYQRRGTEAVLRLSRAMSNLPPTHPMPDPMPPAPPEPMSELGLLNVQVSQPTLTSDEQRILVSKLKGHLNKAGTSQDARILLNRLRRHPDLILQVAEEIDQLTMPPRPVVSAPPPAPAPVQQPKLEPLPVRRSRFPLAWLVVILVLAAGGAYLLLRDNEPPDQTSEENTTPTLADEDFDGIDDRDDACSTEGDQGFGVGADGCPNPPELSGSELVLSDGFDQFESYPSIDEAIFEGYSSGYTYVMRLTEPRSATAAWHPVDIDDESDFLIQTTVQSTEHSGYFYGLAWGNDQYEYYYYLSPYGIYSFNAEKYSGAFVNSEEIIDRTESPYINDGSTENVMTVIRSGRGLSLYINNRFVNKIVPYESIPITRVGIFIAGQITAEFNEFIVRVR